MTDAQRDAQQKIKHLMREHFEAGVCVLQYDNARDLDESVVNFHGGFFKAVGLVQNALWDLRGEKESAFTRENHEEEEE